VFENRVLDLRWRKGQETGIRLNSEELCNLYTSPNSIMVIKRRRMRWVGHVANMRDKKCIQYFG